MLYHDAIALINRLDSRDPGFTAALSSLLAFEATEDESIDRAATAILTDVRHRGDAAFIDQVEAAIERLLPTMPRADILRVSLASRGALILVESLEQACAIANDIAPEHLEISTEKPEKWTDLIRHVGAIFMGRFNSEVLGDYCAGPNHVLPTSCTARFSSPLGVYDFQKRSSLIQVSAQGAQTLGRVAAELALGEGLQAHAASVQYRLYKP